MHHRERGAPGQLFPAFRRVVAFCNGLCQLQKEAVEEGDSHLQCRLHWEALLWRHVGFLRRQGKHPRHTFKYCVGDSWPAPVTLSGRNRGRGSLGASLRQLFKAPVWGRACTRCGLHVKVRGQLYGASSRCRLYLCTTSKLRSSGLYCNASAR